MATKKAKTTTKAPKKDGAYELEVSVNDILYKTDAPTLAEAITNFVESSVFPVGIKTRVLLTYRTGKTECRKVYSVVQGRRVFSRLAHKPAVIELIAGKLEAELA